MARCGRGPDNGMGGGPDRADLDAADGVTVQAAGEAVGGEGCVRGQRDEGFRHRLPIGVEPGSAVEAPGIQHCRHGRPPVIDVSLPISRVRSNLKLVKWIAWFGDDSPARRARRCHSMNWRAASAERATYPKSETTVVALIG